eukprot:10531581-Lingulodinium_polyedra.AAC.1
MAVTAARVGPGRGQTPATSTSDARRRPGSHRPRAACCAGPAPWAPQPRPHRPRWRRPTRPGGRR